MIDTLTIVDNHDETPAPMTIRGAVKALIAYSGVRPENEEAFVKFIDWHFANATFELAKMVDELRAELDGCREANRIQANQLWQNAQERRQLEQIITQPYFTRDDDTEEMYPVIEGDS